VRESLSISRVALPRASDCTLAAKWQAGNAATHDRQRCAFDIVATDGRSKFNGRWRVRLHVESQTIVCSWWLASRNGSTSRYCLRMASAPLKGPRLFSVQPNRSATA
jgi:hypothetical protein